MESPHLREQRPIPSSQATLSGNICDCFLSALRASVVNSFLLWVISVH